MEQKSLIQGRMLICPRCKKSHDILQYISLETIPEFAMETTPVYKCCSCKWIFAPAGESPVEMYTRLESLLAQYQSRECDCSKS